MNDIKPWGKNSFEFDTNRETEIEVCIRFGFYSKRSPACPPRCKPTAGTNPLNSPN
jgi:hypothetical protein